MKRLLAVLMAAAMLGATSAGDPAERMADPVKEARARHLFKELRCMICQNESLDDSEALFAADLRRDVREQLAAGATDRQVLDFMQARYSEYVLLKPPFTPGNLVLWLGPFAVVIITAGAMILAQRRKPAPATPLEADEMEALAALMTENNAQIAPQLGRKKRASPS